jgi:hypothetical protein
MPDDGHSPATCNYRACNARQPTGSCPFVADEPSPSRGLDSLASDLGGMKLERKAELLDELRDVLIKILEQD